MCDVGDGAVLELMMSQYAFFGEGMLKNGRGERGYWLLQGGLLLEKKE